MDTRFQPQVVLLVVLFGTLALFHGNLLVPVNAQVVDPSTTETPTTPPTTVPTAPDPAVTTPTTPPTTASTTPTAAPPPPPGGCNCTDMTMTGCQDMAGMPGLYPCPGGKGPYKTNTTATCVCDSSRDATRCAAVYKCYYCVTHGVAKAPDSSC